MHGKVFEKRDNMHCTNEEIRYGNVRREVELQKQMQERIVGIQIMT